MPVSNMCVVKVKALRRKITGAGLESIPDKEKLIQIEAENAFDQISEKQAEMESRIIYSFEVDGCCTCDNNILKL